LSEKSKFSSSDIQLLQILADTFKQTAKDLQRPLTQQEEEEVTLLFCEKHQQSTNKEALILLRSWLPTTPGEAEITLLVKQWKTHLTAKSCRDLPNLMGAVMPLLGARSDVDNVAQFIREELASGR
jgi:uncharacterized protein YqeY